MGKFEFIKFSKVTTVDLPRGPMDMASDFEAEGSWFNFGLDHTFLFL